MLCLRSANGLSLTGEKHEIDKVVALVSQDVRVIINVGAKFLDV